MAATKTILLVDDDDDLRETLAEQLGMHAEFTTIQAPNATEGMKLAEAERIDLILLDVDMPDMDGREACKLMRKNGVHVPIIMLTGQTTDADTILGLESGANDYVNKPFKFSVLLARVRTHLRSFEQSEDATFKIGPYEFRPSMKLLTDENDRKIRLTEKETNILKFLYRAGGKSVARDKLLEEVWGYNAAVTTHTLACKARQVELHLKKPASLPKRAFVYQALTGGHAKRVELVAVQIAEIGCIKSIIPARAGLTFACAAFGQGNLVNPVHLIFILGFKGDHDTITDTLRIAVKRHGEANAGRAIPFAPGDKGFSFHHARCVHLFGDGIIELRAARQISCAQCDISNHFILLHYSSRIAQNKTLSCF